VTRQTTAVKKSNTWYSLFTKSLKSVKKNLLSYLSTVFANEFILFARHLDIDAPASHIRGGKQKMLNKHNKILKITFKTTKTRC